MNAAVTKIKNGSYTMDFTFRFFEDFPSRARPQTRTDFPDGRADVGV